MFMAKHTKAATRCKRKEKCVGGLRMGGDGDGQVYGWGVWDVGCGGVTGCPALGGLLYHLVNVVRGYSSAFMSKAKR